MEGEELLHSVNHSFPTEGFSQSASPELGKLEGIYLTRLQLESLSFSGIIQPI